MKNFHIEYPDEGLREALIDKINNLTKPKGSLGVLEDLALQIGLIQQTLSPTLSHPHNVLFAADHGIVEEGVSKSPKEITWQQLSNFLHGGAGVNFLCRQHGFKLVLVDSGVDYDLPYEKGIINCSVGRGDCGCSDGNVRSSSVSWEKKSLWQPCAPGMAWKRCAPDGVKRLLGQREPVKRSLYRAADLYFEL